LIPVFFLQSRNPNAFSKYIRPEYLVIGIEVLLANFLVIIAIIYLNLYLRKRNFFYKKEINQQLEAWITKAILDEPDKVEQGFEIPRKFNRVLKKFNARQIVIDELVAIRKELTGAAAKNIIVLYEQLGLKKHSLNKLSSRKWHVKSKGIMELYIMDQNDTLKRIYKNTNSNNEFIRMEAQIGVIHMTGFDGLRFLDVVSYPITEWQQIKLLEQLRLSREDGQLAMHIPKWLRSKNDTVVVFTLKLADAYQQFSVHDEVVKALQHPNEMVRIQAVKTLVRIANTFTPQILAEHYENEHFTNRLNILDAISKIGTEEQAWFLIGLLDDESDVIKLKAGKAFAACFKYGMEALEERGKAKKGAYQKIYLHIKAELGR